MLGREEAPDAADGRRLGRMGVPRKEVRPDGTRPSRFCRSAICLRTRAMAFFCSAIRSVSTCSLAIIRISF